MGNGVRQMISGRVRMDTGKAARLFITIPK
jgi:hypothetical protein